MSNRTKTRTKKPSPHRRRLRRSAAGLKTMRQAMRSTRNLRPRKAGRRPQSRQRMMLRRMLTRSLLQRRVGSRLQSLQRMKKSRTHLLRRSPGSLPKPSRLPTSRKMIPLLRRTTNQPLQRRRLRTGRRRRRPQLTTPRRLTQRRPRPSRQSARAGARKQQQPTMSERAIHVALQVSLPLMGRKQLCNRTQMVS